MKLFMNVKRKISLFVMVLGLCCIGASCVISFLDEDIEDEKIEEKEEISKEDVIKVIEEDFLSLDTNYAKITSYMGNEILNENYVVLGTDSYLRKIPNSSEDLTEYKKIQDEYVSKVEQTYLDNTKYEVVEDIDGLRFNIQPWLFVAYSTDMSVLINKLLNLAGVDETLIETNYEEYSLYEYKAKVKALTILDSYLSFYNNSDETFKFLFYLNGSSDLESQYFSLYLNFVGNVSKMVTSDTTRDTRVNQYLYNAINLGIVNLDNPLSI